MSQNPDQTPDESRPQADSVIPNARLSTAALSSALLVFGAILIGCGSLLGSILGGWNSWMGVIVAPLLALNGCIMAFLALKGIEKAGGQLIGRPLALCALFIGVGVTAIQGAMVLLALVTLSASSTLAPVGAEFVGYAQSDRIRLSRQLISSEVAGELSDEQITRFAKAIEQELGVVTGGSASFRLVRDARRAMADAGSLDGYSVEAADQPRPVYLEFGDQRALAYIYLDHGALQDKQIRIRDMFVYLGNGRAIVLREDGLASEFVRAAGWRPVRAEPADQDLMLE